MARGCVGSWRVRKWQMLETVLEWQEIVAKTPKMWPENQAREILLLLREVQRVMVGTLI